VILSLAPAVTHFTREAQDLLRDPSHFKWYTVTLLLFVAYIYSVEIERRRWDIVLAGVTLWLADWINEIANALVLHITHRAAVWTVTGDTSYLILIGLTIEITMMRRSVYRIKRNIWSYYHNTKKGEAAATASPFLMQLVRELLLLLRLGRAGGLVRCVNGGPELGQHVL